MRRSRWNVYRFRLQRILWALFLLLHLDCEKSFCLNLEGLALLEFRSKVDVDPYGAFNNWNHEDSDPCNWFGVHCIDGKVETLNLKGLSLGGTLAPELGKLRHLRSLVLQKNNFSGAIPKEYGNLILLEVLDLRGNNLSGKVPAKMGEMISLGHLLLCVDKFQDSTSPFGTLGMLSELKCEQNLPFHVPTELGCMNRKLGYCMRWSGLQVKKDDSFLIPYKGKVLSFIQMLPWFSFKKDFPSHVYGEKHGANIPILSEPYMEDNMQTSRRKLLEVSSNLPAATISGSSPQEDIDVPSVGSGSFSAVPQLIGGETTAPQDLLPNSISLPNTNSASLKPSDSAQNHPTFSENLRKVIVFAVSVLAILIAIVAGTLAWRTQHVSTVGPWKTGLSGPLQKAFTAGVPKLNRAELEAACEDFSNIITNFPNSTLFKGILSSGVEIGVVSTVLKAKDWSKRSEAHFRKKVDTLSRINHKNFVNLLGYCEENEPFMRMMVFEYAPNGTLCDHLHSKENEHLDWSARMRIIMGTTYCLEYMHHEVNPPLALPDLQSNSIFLTDDYSAKVCDICIWKELVARRKKSMDEDNDPSNSPCPDSKGNVYNFGMLLLETISGKLQYSNEEGSILNWAADHLNDRSNIKNLVDPTLKSFKDSELEIICEVIQECINGDPKKRPTMREISSKLREVLGISPEAACPRLSPLWWAELEILSVEAS